MKQAGLWIAQGFGLGRIPVAPGTFGSVLGVGWFALLLTPRAPWALTAGILAGFALSVWLCGEAERMLGKTDPGSVVLDEITAIPLCFAGWVAVAFARLSSWPSPGWFFEERRWIGVIAVFILFRAFDIAKPWPVRQSQQLPGGWGVTVDDFLAAVYVNAVLLALHAAAGWIGWSSPLL